MNETKRHAIAQVEALSREIATDLGLEIVEFVFHDQGRHSQIRIDVDRAGVPGVTLTDCERLSRALDARIEALEGLDSAYELQVSSPGIDRPIRSDDDIRRNTGRHVRLEFRDDQGRVAEHRGTLGGLDDQGAILIFDDGEERRVPKGHILLMKQEVKVGGARRHEG